MSASASLETLEGLRFIVDRINVGIVVVDAQMRIALWNRFMANYSGRSSEELLGQDLCAAFPELPKAWLEKKIRSVFAFKNFAFTSWEQRPYLFRFNHNRPVSGGVQFMQQDCTFMPLRDAAGEVAWVSITLNDVTDTSIYQSMLRDALQRLETSNRTDGLTGIFNRKHWESRLSEEFNRNRRHSVPLSLIMLDIDHFKRLNDGYGHLCGDEVLQAVAQNIGKNLRDIDVLGRYGGEEFGVLLPNTELAGACIVAERLRAGVENLALRYQEQELKVTVSLGVAELSADMERYDRLIAQADERLYQSKRAGRNRWTASEPTPAV